MKNVILDEFPQQSAGPVLVTYREGAPPFVIAEGYLMAAERLAKTLNSRGQDTTEDQLAFPLLFLVRHSLEISLKGYLSVLLNHRQKSTCSNLRDIDASPLKRHELISIFDSISSAIMVDELHSDAGLFAEFKNFIYSMDSMDLSSESLRYTKDKDGDISLFFQDQKYVVIKELLNITRAFTDFIHSVAENHRFDLCSGNIFVKENILSYRFCVRFAQQISAQRDSAIKATVPLKEGLNSTSDLFENYLENRESKERFYKKVMPLIEKMDSVKRANVALALEIIKKRGYDSGLSYFVDQGEKFVDRYISNNLMQLTVHDADKFLLDHLNYILELKEKWRPPKRGRRK